MRIRSMTGLILPAAACALAGLAAADEKNPPAMWTYQDFLAKKTPQSYTVRAGHPRLILTPENRKEIVEKIKAAPKLWQRTIQQAEGGDGWRGLMACGAIHQLGLVPGFEYSMSRAEYGRKGVEALMKLELPVRGHQVNFHYIAVPCAYDWLYDLLTPPQRKQIAARLVEEVRKHSRGKRAGSFQLPQPNCPAGQAMIFGLAFYGDGVDDAAAKEIIDGVWHRVLWNPDVRGGHLSPLQIIRYLPDGVNSEGLGYSCYHVGFPAHAAAWKTATGVDWFARMGYFRRFPYWMTHTHMPGNDGKLRFVVPFHQYTHGGQMWHRSANLNVAAATGYLADVDPAGAALAQWWLRRQRAGSMEGVDYPLLHGLLLGDPRVKPKSPAALKLPLTYVMRGLNHVHMRSAYWDDPDATVVGFSNNRYACYRCDAHNHFFLCKNGAPLLLYRGNVAFHNYCGGDKTPYNTVAFFKGDRAIVVPHQSALGSPADAPKHEIGTLAVDSVAGEYDYMVGQVGKGYRTRRNQDVQRADRTLVYLRPQAKGGADYVVVLDRTRAAAASVVPHVVFNTVFEPRVGRTWDAAEAGRKVHEGQWAVDAARCVTVTMNHEYKAGRGKQVVLKAHGRAFLKVLYPRDVRILKIGGPDHYMDDITGRGSDGQYLKAFRTASRDAQIDRGGYWRFHVVPKTASAEHTILTVIEPTDSKVVKPSTMELLEGKGILGVRLATSVVLFSADGKPLTAGEVPVPLGGAFRLLVGDLRPGAEYTLTAGKSSLKLKATAAGTAFVKSVTGETVRVEAAAGR